MNIKEYLTLGSFLLGASAFASNTIATLVILFSSDDSIRDRAQKVHISAMSTAVIAILFFLWASL
jgi:hypothetical protein